MVLAFINCQLLTHSVSLFHFGALLPFFSTIQKSSYKETALLNRSLAKIAVASAHSIFVVRLPLVLDRSWEERIQPSL